MKHCQHSVCRYPLTDDCESYVHTDDEGAFTAEESESYLKSEEEVYARAQAEFAELLQPQHSKVSRCRSSLHGWLFSVSHLVFPILHGSCPKWWLFPVMKMCFLSLSVLLLYQWKHETCLWLLMIACTIFDLISVQYAWKNCAMEKCQGICSYKHTQKFASVDNKV